MLTGNADSGAMDLTLSDSPIGLPEADNRLIAGRPLTRMEKAAVVIRLLLQQGVEVPLDDLPEAVQDNLILLMSRMRAVDRDTVARVVEEFQGELEMIGLLFPRGMSRALEALGGSLSPEVTGRARAKLGLGDTYDPWERLNETENERIVPLLLKESPEVSAIILSKLKVAKAAEILSAMPGREARRIAYAMSLTTAVPLNLVGDIGRALFEQLRIKPSVAFEKGPVERVGAILNSTGSGTRDDVLAGLDEADRLFAEQVRKAIFTFENIPTRISPRDVPKILRGLEQATIVTALAAAAAKPDDQVSPFIFANMSSRLAQQLQEEIAARGKVKEKDAEVAINDFVKTIRDLADTGEILFVASDDEEE